MTEPSNNPLVCYWFTKVCFLFWCFLVLRAGNEEQPLFWDCWTTQWHVHFISNYCKLNDYIMWQPWFKILDCHCLYSKLQQPRAQPQSKSRQQKHPSTNHNQHQHQNQNNNNNNNNNNASNNNNNNNNSNYYYYYYDYYYYYYYYY